MIGNLLKLKNKVAHNCVFVGGEVIGEKIRYGVKNLILPEDFSPSYHQVWLFHLLKRSPSLTILSKTEPPHHFLSYFLSSALTT